MPLGKRRPVRGFAPLLLVLLVPALLAGAEASPPSGNPTPAARARKLPPIFDPQAVGTKAIEAAVKICNETHRRPFVIFGTNDCAPCRTFNDALYEPTFFNAFIVQFVPIFIDASPGGPNGELLKNYGIDPSKGFPAIGIFELEQVPPEITRNGEAVAVAKKGTKAAQEWILARFKKDTPEGENR